MQLNKNFLRPSFIALIIINILSFNLLTEINSNRYSKNHLNRFLGYKKERNVTAFPYSTELKDTKETYFPFEYKDLLVKCPTGFALSDFQAWGNEKKAIQYSCSPLSKSKIEKIEKKRICGNPYKYINNKEKFYDVFKPNCSGIGLISSFLLKKIYHLVCIKYECLELKEKPICYQTESSSSTQNLIKANFLNEFNLRFLMYEKNIFQKCEVEKPKITWRNGKLNIRDKIIV